jgi:hypothetical protein
LSAQCRQEELKLRKTSEQEIIQLKMQLNEAINIIAAFKEEIQTLRDEIVVLKGEKQWYTTGFWWNSQ